MTSAVVADTDVPQRSASASASASARAANYASIGPSSSSSSSGPSEKSPAVVRTNNPFHMPAPPGWRPVVYHVRLLVAYLTATLSMMAGSCMMPVVLLYMDFRRFTTSTDVRAFVTASALYTMGPIFGHTLMTKVAKAQGHGFAMMVTAFISVAGLLLIIAAPDHLGLFYLGYLGFSLFESLRVVRLAFLSKIVPTADRTTAISFHALSYTAGGMLGPLIWIACQTFRANLTAAAGTLSVNRFTICFFALALVLTAVAVLSRAFLDEPLPTPSDPPQPITIPDNLPDQQQPLRTPRPAPSKYIDLSGIEPVHITLPDGSMAKVNLKWFRIKLFMIFCTILGLMNCTTGVYMTSLQPILLSKFHRTDSQFGQVYVLVGMFAMIPPLLVSFLSRRLKDRRIIMLGITIKMAGVTCYLGSDVPMWRVVLGFILIVKASLFFMTSALSLFSKLNGPLLVPDLIGYVMSAFMAGRAVGQFYSTPVLLEFFDTPRFALFAIPGVVAASITFSPPVWKLADPDHPYIVAIHKEAERIRSECA